MSFLTFLVATHLATAIVLLGFFWRDWVRIVKGLGRSLRNREIGADPDAKLGFSYCCNQMHAVGTNGPRARRLIDAVYAVVG